MIKTLTSTTASAINAEMVSMREEFGATTLGRVMTLLIVTDGDDSEAPVEAAIQASHEHPCRVIVLRTHSHDADGLDAEIRVGRDAGAGDIVILDARGQVTSALDTLVIPLLLPDAPIVVWWPTEAPSNPRLDVLGTLAQRRITDARESSDPAATLKRLRRGYMHGDTDLSWSRITNWRGLVASAFETTPATKPTEIVLHGAADDPTVVLFKAWVELELGIEPTIEEPSPRTRKNRDLTGVTLRRKDGDITLERISPETIELTLPGSTTPQHVTMPRRSLFECLAEEMRRLGPDAVYGDALCRAFSAIDDPAVFADGKPEPTDQVASGPVGLAGTAAEAITAQLASAIAERGSAHLVLTGGTIGVRTAAELADAIQAHGMDVSKLHVWWGDERFVAAESEDRNANQVRAGFLDKLGLRAEHVHEMPSTGQGMSLDEAAQWYAHQLDLAGGDVAFHTRGSAFFDVLMLGVGPDGHIASLFPQHPDQKETAAIAAGVRNSPKPPPERITLTWPTLNSARHVALLVSGEEKSEAVLRGHRAILPWTCPASSVRGLESTTWYLDEAAARAL